MTRVRGITEQVTDAARRVLRLSTIRARFANAIDKAEHDQLTYRGFLAELLMAGMEPAGYRGNSWLRCLAGTRIIHHNGARQLPARRVHTEQWI